MAESRLEKQGSPTGVKRLLFRAPIYLYRWHLGFLLGKRFVMLEHVGRRSGEVRRTVLEVVMLRNAEVFVAAAWGERADWLLNVKASPDIVYQVGSKRRRGRAETLDRPEARSVLADYAAKHEGTFRRLAEFMVDDPGDSPEEWVENVGDIVPIVRLAPTEPPSRDDSLRAH